MGKEKFSTDELVKALLVQVENVVLKSLRDVEIEAIIDRLHAFDRMLEKAAMYLQILQEKDK